MQIYWSGKPPHLTPTPNKVPPLMKHKKCLKNLSDTIRPKLERGSPICDSKWTGAKNRQRMRMGQKRKPRSFSKERFRAWAKTSTLIACGLSMSTFWPKICTWVKDWSSTLQQFQPLSQNLTKLQKSKDLITIWWPLYINQYFISIKTELVTTLIPSLTTLLKNSNLKLLHRVFQTNIKNYSPL